MPTVRSFCQVCTSVCGILVEVNGEDVIAVHGDRDHPFSHGYTCPKGRALPQMHHHPDRLERPLMRIDGELRPTTWDACLDDLHAIARPDRRRSASTSARVSAWTPSATGSPSPCTLPWERRQSSAR